MEILIELIVEVFGEIFLELIFGFVAWVSEGLFNRFDRNPNSRKTLKNIIGITFFTLAIVAMILSIMFHKSQIVLATAIYLLAIVILQFFKFIKKQLLYASASFNIFYQIYKRIIKYGFPIVLMVLVPIYVANTAAIVLSIVGCSIALVVYLAIDSFRIWRYVKNKRLAALNEKTRR